MISPDVGAAFEIPFTSMSEPDLRYFHLKSQQYGYFGITKYNWCWYYSIYHNDVNQGYHRPFFPAGYEYDLISLYAAASGS